MNTSPIPLFITNKKGRFHALIITEFTHHRSLRKLLKIYTKMVKMAIFTKKGNYSNAQKIKSYKLKGNLHNAQR